ncbi:unnamed protein product [Bemisia tabaci]|uniref:Osiris 18 n=1 Tax=Bemisia tabaci TaxID=7038 RepID=A0A9P0CBP5_BEMTA|nr:unnamed protein product [Bemisia tabaci]
MDCRVLILCVVLPQMRARTIRSADASENQVDLGSTLDKPPRSEFMSDVRTVFRVYEECSKDDLSSCLKSKLVSGLERLSQRPELALTETISFVRDGPSPSERTEKALGDAEMETFLPRTIDERHSFLNQLIIKQIVDFFTTHSLKIKIPLLDSFFFGDEGRGKKNKYGSLLLMPFVMGGMMIPLAFGALALLAGKALIISKLALALAALIGMKKFVGGGGGGHASYNAAYEVLTHPAGTFRRSFTEEDLAAAAATNLAYRAYIPLNGAGTPPPTVTATLIKTS